MNIDRILASAPINGTAASVVSSPRHSQPQGDITRQEVIELRERLNRKLRLLKKVLKITSRAQHKNLIYAITRGQRGQPGTGMLRLTANPRVALEYKRVGEEIHRMDMRVVELNAAIKRRQQESQCEAAALTAAQSKEQACSE